MITGFISCSDDNLVDTARRVNIYPVAKDRFSPRRLKKYRYVRDTARDAVTHWTLISALRSLAWPSQSGGIVPRFALPAKIFDSSIRSLAVSLPTRIFVPSSSVIGRSVLCRKVRHGTPKYVVSS